MRNKTCMQINPDELSRKALIYLFYLASVKGRTPVEALKYLVEKTAGAADVNPPKLVVAPKTENSNI